MHQCIKESSVKNTDKKRGDALLSTAASGFRVDQYLPNSIALSTKYR